MPVHDWSQVAYGVFHDFHCSWITHLKELLNRVLPAEYYAMAEQSIGNGIADVVTLAIGEDGEADYPASSAGGTMTVSVSARTALRIEEMPPRVTRHLILDDPERPLTLVSYLARPETPEAFVEATAVGQTLARMPLFLEHDCYIDVPLEDSYQEAWQGVPAALRPSC